MMAGAFRKTGRRGVRLAVGIAVLSSIVSCSSLVTMALKQGMDGLGPSYRVAFDYVFSVQNCLYARKAAENLKQPLVFEFDLELKEDKYHASPARSIAAAGVRQEVYDKCLDVSAKNANVHAYMTDDEKTTVARWKPKLSMTSFLVRAEIVSSQKATILMTSTNDGGRKPTIIRTFLEDSSGGRDLYPEVF